MEETQALQQAIGILRRQNYYITIPEFQKSWDQKTATEQLREVFGEKLQTSDSFASPAVDSPPASTFGVKNSNLSLGCEELSTQTLALAYHSNMSSHHSSTSASCSSNRLSVLTGTATSSSCQRNQLDFEQIFSLQIIITDVCKNAMTHKTDVRDWPDKFKVTEVNLAAV
ncbi:uncharacterized protein V6R79_012255 [Siganus canaliculatus]